MDGTEYKDSAQRRPQQPQATLTMQEGPYPGRVFTIDKPITHIGRQAGNDIAISDPEISRHHANITWEGANFVIRDMGSANGTFVNGAMITAPCILRDGDVIGLGELLFSFRLSTTTIVTPDEMTTLLREPGGPGYRGGLPAAPPGLETGVSTWLPIAVGAGLAILVVLIVVGVVLLFIRPQGPAVPTVIIDSPPAGTHLTLGETLTVQSTATDVKGVTKIELWVDAALYRADPSPDAQGQRIFSVRQPWTPASAGIHTLVARAYNVDGRASESAPLVVSVEPGTPRAEISPTSTETPVPQSVLSPTPTHTPTSTPTPTPTCVPNASFVADVTVPDYSIFKAGERIDKIWRLRNSGSCSWENGYTLSFVSGAQMGAQPAQNVAFTPPGGTTDIQATMYAPAAEGVYKGVWQMKSSTGQFFGDRVVVIIRVEPPTPPPHPPAAPSGLVAIPLSGTQVKLSWNDNSDNETGFRIFREGLPDVVGTVGANVTTFVADNLDCNATYRFLIVAYNDFGQSAASNVAQATTQACQQAVIHYFNAEPQLVSPGQSARLSWYFEQAREAYIQWPGGEMGITGPTGETWVQPNQTTTYKLIAYGRGGSETNAEKTVTISVGQPTQPDLVVSSIGVSGDCYVNATVTNVGSVRAEAAILYVGVVNAFSQERIATIAQSPFVLEAGGMTVFQAGSDSVKIVGAGWQVRATVDEGNAVAESDENNNSREEAIACGTSDRPPTVVVQLSSPHPFVAEIFQVTVTAEDDVGLESIWWWFENPPPGDSGPVQPFSCSGPTCSNTWSKSVGTPGIYTIQARARDLAGNLSAISSVSLSVLSH